MCVKPQGPFGPASTGSKERLPQESPMSRNSQWFDCPCPWRTARENKRQSQRQKSARSWQRICLCQCEYVLCTTWLCCRRRLWEGNARQNTSFLQNNKLCLASTTTLENIACDNDEWPCALNESDAHIFPSCALNEHVNEHVLCAEWIPCTHLSLPEKKAGHSQDAFLRRQWYVSLVKDSLALVSCVEQSNQLQILVSLSHNSDGTHILNRCQYLYQNWHLVNDFVRI